MAPIRKGDGTGFTPKGFAGVRKGDGTILYSAEPAIPDAQLTWKIDEGTGSTVTDSEGSNDGTISGASWVSDSNFFANYALGFADGDYVDASPLSYVTTGGSWTIALEIELDETTEGDEFWTNTVNSGNDRAMLAHNANGLNAWTYDGSSFIDTVGDVSLSTGSKSGVILVCDSGTLSLHTESVDETSAASKTTGVSSSSNIHRLGEPGVGTGFDGRIGIYQADNSAWDSDKRQQFFDTLP